MAMRTFTTAGVNNLWSNAANWDTAPVDTDGFTIPNGQTCEFDADQSAWAGMAASTIAAGGKLIASTTAGAYVLKMNADLTVNGTLQAGTSVAVPYPSTCTFTIDFSSTAKSIECSATGQILLYCSQPTNKYVTLTGTEIIGSTRLEVNTNLVSDTLWAVGSDIRIVDATVAKDSEIKEIAAVAATYIDICLVGGGAGGLAAQKEANALIILVTRNIRIINVAASDYAITFAATAGSGSYIGAELNVAYRGINGGTNYEFAGVYESSTATNAITNSYKAIISGVLCGCTVGSPVGLMTSYGCSITGLIAGMDTATQGCANLTISGLIQNSSYSVYTGQGVYLIESGQIKYMSYGMYQSSGLFIYGTISSCTRGLYFCNDLLISGTLSSNVTADLDSCISGKFYNATLGSATEFANYNSILRGKPSFIESFNHDGSINVYKAWCLGGIVTSQTASPPTGYEIWYEHACEYVSTGSFPCFRQYETTVLPGTVLEVIGKIRIADGENLSTDPPALQIIDKFADPLVDSTQSPLDEDEVTDATGATTDWQDVDVIWANTGDSPRQVFVRMYASVAGHGDAVDVDEVWAIATYQEQIAALYNSLIPIRTDVAVANSATSFTLTAGMAATNAYRHNTLAIQDSDDGHWEQRKITSWTSGRVVTVDNPFTFTPAVGDLCYILSAGYGASMEETVKRIKRLAPGGEI